MSGSIRRFGFLALGTQCVVAIPDGLDPTLPLGIAMEQLDLLESLASGFNPNSEVRRLSDNSDGEAHLATHDLIEIVEIAKLAGSITGGMCDFSIGAEVLKLGLRDRKNPSGRQGQFEDDADVPVPKVIATTVPGYERILVDRENSTITIPKGARLDLHSVSKSFYADRIAAMISETFSSPVLVGLGGDIAVRQASDSEPIEFCVEVLTGANSRQISQKIFLLQGGMATSGIFRPVGVKGDELGQPHIIDPKTMRVAKGGPLSVTFAAEHAWIANAFSTATVACGLRANAYAASIGLPCLVVSEDHGMNCYSGWPVPAEIDPGSAASPTWNPTALEGVLA